MTIQDWGSIGELVAAIATVATLAYLAVQIRRTDTTARAQSRQTMIDTWSGTNWDLARDPRMLRAFAAGLSKWPDISDEDKTIFDTGMGRYLANIQNGIMLRDAGLLDGEVLDRTADYMVVCVTSNGGKRWWRDTFNAWPQTREYIEQRIAAGDVAIASLEEAGPYWMALANEPPPDAAD